MNAKTLVVLLAVVACAFAFNYSRMPPSICLEPIELGRCRAHEPRYAYNPNEKKCVEFYYGGCEGNDNNFRTLEDCKNTCE